MCALSPCTPNSSGRTHSRTASSLQFSAGKNPDQVTMAQSFTRLLSGRNTAVMLTGIGAGTLACGYLLSDGTAAAERRRMFPPRWQFACEGADIGFGVFLKAKRGEWKKAAQMQEVVHSQRYNAHLVPEDGSLTCEHAGVYVIRFDNTYSIFQAKRISFTVEILLPDNSQPPQTNGAASKSVEAENNSPL
ncbi:SEC14 2 [Solea senegalensis]|uniref:SEC14 2 n=1 Tax=Solea senegalensis TaxID=28829 RepID=A0AAV6QIS0_SOLSE|nr:SEC14 2 [Solea senegalensis]